VTAAGYQDLLMAAADKRLGLATEVINNIKVVKFFAWVRGFSDVYRQAISKSRPNLTNYYVFPSKGIQLFAENASFT
jgi:hypothetical protein